MRKRIVALLAGAMLMAAGSAMAIPLNPDLVRPVTINPAFPGENSLQNELNSIYGSGVVSAATDQLKVGMFQVALPGSNLISPQFKFEWTSNASSQTVGIFGWNGTNTVDAQIFAGAHNAGDFANIIWNTNNSGVIQSFDSPSLTTTSTAFNGIDRNFFGFFFDVNGANPGQRYYSVDSLNPNGEARVLGFEPTLSGATFSYEDGTDFDYQDAGFLVESIVPVPEPGTLMLLGLGMFGLAVYGKRRMNKEA